MKKYSDEEVLYAFRILTDSPLLYAPEDPSSNEWIKYKLFNYILQKHGKAYIDRIDDDLKLKFYTRLDLLRQMRNSGMVVTEQRDGKEYAYIGQKALYILESGRIAPLNVDKLRIEYRVDDAAFEVDKIKTNKDELLRYLKTIVRLETIVYSYAKRYETLCAYRIDALKAGISDAIKVSKQIADEVDKKKRKLKKLEKSIPKEPTLSNIVVNLDRAVPRKPKVTASKPAEPLYEKPGLFNKKKVKEENARLRREYETELAKYESAIDAYKIEYESYKRNLADYNKEIAERKEQQLALLKAEYASALSEFNENKGKLEDEIVELQSKTEEKWMQLLSQSESYSRRLAIDAEAQINEQFLRDTLKALMELYSYGVIYDKYRNMVAVSSFCDYLLAGRCEMLEGADGAYNLYEQETRSDLISEKLDKVIASLAAIQKNQYYIYSEIQASNAKLEKIENQLVTNNAIQKSQLKMLKEICKNTDGIADTLKEIAFNTEVTAFYAKQNKELTDALGYMVALK